MKFSEEKLKYYRNFSIIAGIGGIFYSFVLADILRYAYENFVHYYNEGQLDVGDKIEENTLMYAASYWIATIANLIVCLHLAIGVWKGWKLFIFVWLLHFIVQILTHFVMVVGLMYISTSEILAILIFTIWTFFEMVVWIGVYRYLRLMGLRKVNRMHSVRV